jgi:hypothetical protein
VDDNTRKSPTISSSSCVGQSILHVDDDDDDDDDDGSTVR